MILLCQCRACKKKVQVDITKLWAFDDIRKSEAIKLIDENNDFNEHACPGGEVIGFLDVVGIVKS